MFCVKCGEKLSEGTVFCPKCGAKANASSAPEQQADSPQGTTPNKKSRLPLFIGVAVLIVVVAGVLAIIGSNGEGDNAPPVTTGANAGSGTPAPPIENVPATQTPPQASASNTTLEDMLVGRWQVVYLFDEFTWFEETDIIEFFADGTGVEHISWGLDAFTWRIDERLGEEELVLSFDSGAGFMDTLRVDGGDIITGFMRFARDFSDVSLRDYASHSIPPVHNIDQALVGGRWISDSGNRIELFADGTGTTDLDLWSWHFGFGAKDITWEAQDGRLRISATYIMDEGYTLNENVLTLSMYGQTFRRTYLYDDGDWIVGRWMPATGGGGGFQIFPDGTGFSLVWGLRYFTWTASDNRITRTFVHTFGFDYVVQGSQLTVFGLDGSTVFTRVGG